MAPAGECFSSSSSSSSLNADGRNERTIDRQTVVLYTLNTICGTFDILASSRRSNNTNTDRSTPVLLLLLPLPAMEEQQQQQQTSQLAALVASVYTRYYSVDRLRQRSSNPPTFFGLNKLLLLLHWSCVYIHTHTFVTKYILLLLLLHACSDSRKLF